jgi:hypothetical protein
MATPNTLKITDGTTTVDFIADSAYHVLRYAPAVATRFPAALVGRGVYSDVIDEMEIGVSGSTLLTKLKDLQNLLDQSVRWSRGEPVAAVNIVYEPESSSALLDAVILGAPGPNEPMIELPDDFPETPLYQYATVRLRFKRSGLWLGDNETKTVAGSANPTVLVMGAFGDLDIESPVILKLVGTPTPESIVWNSFILMTSALTSAGATSRLQILNAEGMALGAYTSVADSANEARNTNILRYTPAGTGAVDSDTENLTTPDTSARRWAMFINYSNNGSTSYKIRGNIHEEHQYSTTPWTAIAGGASDPKWIYLGSASLNNAITKVSVTIQASAASSSIDIDSVAMLAVDNEATDRAIAILPKTAGLATGADDLVIDHRLETHIQPAVYIDSTARVNQIYLGDARLYMRGKYMAVVWLATGGNAAGDWRATNPASGTVLSLGFEATRTVGLLTPK